MSERIVICSTAQQAAEFCVEERVQESIKFGRAGSSARRGGRGGHHYRGQRGGRSWQGSAHGAQKPHKNHFKAGKSFRSGGNVSFMHDHLLIGDSILVRTARSNGVQVSKHNLTCFGGATIKSVLENLSQLSENPKKALVLVGINDLMNGRSKHDILKDEEMQHVLQDKGVESIKLLTIPPVSENRRNAKDWDYVNDNIANNKLSLTTIIPIHKIFVGDDGSLRRDLYELFYASGKKDLVHPNAKGLKEINDAIAQYVSGTNAVYHSSENTEMHIDMDGKA